MNCLHRLPFLSVYVTLLLGGMIYSRAAELLEAEVGNELVALDVKAGQCLGFNDVATDVWRLLQTPKSLEELRNSLLEEYDVSVEECTQDLAELLDEMRRLGLIRATE